MSNALAIATVTAALQRRLQALIDDAGLAEQIVSTSHPPADNAKPGVYVFLYQVEPNPAWRNADLPTRRSTGEGIRRPQVALTLRYLISFVGEGAKLEPERLLGLTVASLHAEPVLSAAVIQDLIDATPADHFLRKSDLDQQVERVRFTPLTMDLETMSRLWSMFNQVPYALSVAYEASVVLIDGPAAEAASGLPVLSTRVRATAAGAPRVEAVQSLAGPSEPIEAGSSIAVLGSSLAGQITRVRIDGLLLEPAVKSDTRLELTLDPAMPAGWKVLDVIHLVDLAAPGEPPEERVASASSTVAFALRPKITSAIQLDELTDEGGNMIGHELRLHATPLPGDDQQVVLLLNEKGGSGGYELHAWQLDGSKLVFSFAPIASGSYLIRLRVDGADSMLEVQDGVFDGPSVEVP